MIDKYGRSELHYAANEANSSLVSQILDTGQDPGLPDSRGWTPLHFAAQANCEECTNLLLSAGAPPDSLDEHGNTPLSTAVFNSRGKGAVIKCLRAAGADPFLANKHGISPVELARNIANYDIKQYFVDVPAPDNG